MNPKKFRESLDAAIGLAIVAYIIYAKVSGDDDLVKLKAHATYYWWQTKMWWKHRNEPAWKKELRAFFTVTPDPVPHVADWIAGDDGLHAG